MPVDVCEIWDLYEAAYHAMNGAEVVCRKTADNKIVFDVESGPLFRRIRREYRENVQVPIKDYTNEVKIMRSRMNSMRLAGQDLRR